MPLSPQEQQELAQLESKYGKPKSSSLSPQEQEELKALESKYGQGEQKEAPGLGQRALDYGLRALDYPGGLVRTGAAGLMGVAGKEDFKKALYGQAPTSADYLERGGVDEGFRVNLSPMEGDTSLRDIEGFALDTLSDPLTAIARGVRGAKGLAGKAADVALNPAEKALEGSGRGLYKSGLKKIDERLIEKGAKPVSDLLLDAGKAGTTKKLSAEAKKIATDLANQRATAYERATAFGAKVDMQNVVRNAEEEVARLRRDPGMAQAADNMSELLEKYKAEGPVDIATASEWKTNLYNALPATAFDQTGRVKAPLRKVQKALAQDFKKAIVDAGNKAEKGLGDHIDKINEKWGTLIGAEKPMQMQIRRGNTANNLTSVDAMLGGTVGMYTHDPVSALGAIALKKAADASKTTYARTKGGMGLIKLGRSGLIDPTIRRGLIDANRD